ncbi:MAG: oligosaccharide flippase family protein, partial [Longimicrobiales bacterium]
MIGAQAARLLISIVTGMALARLLDPTDFGIFAMVLSLTAFVTSFSDFGLGMAAVQREHVHDSELNALFWLGVRLSGLTFLFMALMAPVLVWFYDEPRLIGVTLVMAFAVVLMELAVQQRAVLVRRMRFATITAIEVCAAVVGAAAGISAAAVGAAYWALVLQFVAVAVAQSAGAWLFCDWRPGRLREARGSGFRALTVYGRDYTLYR